MDGHGEHPRQLPGGRLSRREFLRHSALAAAGLGLAASLPGAVRRLLAQDAVRPAPPGAGDDLKGIKLPRSRVVVITHPEAIIRDYLANRPLLEKMIERAVRELTGADSELKAWQQVATSGDRVTIKTTRAGGPKLKTHREIPAYITRRLTELAKVDADKIRSWDRPDLRGADLELSEAYLLPTRKKETRLRAALVKDTTAIINLPVLKMHSGSGASMAMKNHFGSINNPSAFHGWKIGRMARSIAELNNLEPIRKRTRLIVVDATRPLLAGGPYDNADYRWTFGGLIVGADPVAVDSVGLGILEKKRAEYRGRPWPATDAREMVQWAQKIGLGNADRSGIDLVTIKLD
ncbi:MAG: DUF362 domain-containing protein [Anaerolineaceae bacterium]|nr:DUF362 domain-containing protein [Anaerolineaceae bacterium]